jgi:CRP-like cAMP-binding protein
VLNEIADRAIVNTYKKGQTIFMQGNNPYGIFCVRSGKIKIVNTNKEGKESITRLVSVGDVFGHRSLLSGQAYHASAKTLEDSVVCFFEKDFILRLIKEHPLLAFNFLAQLSEEVGIAETKNSTFVHKNARERLGGLLINLKESYGVSDLKGIRLEIKLTREDMAAMIGSTHETLVRLFTEFKNEEIIIQEGKVIFIINEKKLNEFANV